MTRPGATSAARLAALLAALVLASVAASACRSRSRSAPAGPGLAPQRGGWFETTRTVYGRIPARVRLRLPEGRAAEADAVAAAVWAEVDRVGRVFNAFDATSETGRLNASSTTGLTPVSADLATVLRTARRVSAAADGAFDPTLWPIKRLWKDAATRGQPPTADEVRAALARTGLAHVHLDDGTPPRLRRDVAGLQLDFGGIAKGYAVDRAAAVARARGAVAALIQVGGEIVTFGPSDEGRWRLGVQHPTREGRLYGVVEHQGTIRVSTSGNYQQPLTIAGQTYYHIFDPRTGRPVSTRTRGVTLAAFDGGTDNATLDALATAATVLGAARGVALARRFGVEALVIDGEPGALRETVTPGFQARWRRPAVDPR
jgi:thiamine biosynthesis lipoprotein